MTEQTTDQAKNEKRMRTLTKIATVFSKLLEIGYDILAVGLVVGLVLFLIDRNIMPGKLLIGQPDPGEEFSVLGFTIVIGGADGNLIDGAMIIGLLTGAMIFTLMAFVFRNVNLILRTTQGQTKFSQGKTPFQKDNVRMVREIGFFFLAIMAVAVVMSIIAALILGPDVAEISIDMESFVIGVLMLCLSQVFALGTQMQQDVDGLV